MDSQNPCQWVVHVNHNPSHKGEHHSTAHKACNNSSFRISIVNSIFHSILTKKITKRKAKIPRPKLLKANLPHKKRFVNDLIFPLQLSSVLAYQPTSSDSATQIPKTAIPVRLNSGQRHKAAGRKDGYGHHHAFTIPNIFGSYDISRYPVPLKSVFQVKL